MDPTLHRSLADAAALIPHSAPLPPVASTCPPCWFRSPAHVLGEGLRRLLAQDGMGAVQAWCQWTGEGAAWLAAQRLIYPQLTRDPTLVWRADASQTLAHGRPCDDWRHLDEWTRVEGQPEVTRGAVGDYGGDLQVAGLYWNMGDNEEVRMTLFDLSRAVGTVGAAAATY